MFPKLVVLIVGVGVCGGSLLAMRQARVQMAHEMAESRLRVRALDEQLSRVRAEIADSVHPDRVEQMASSLGPMEPALPSDVWNGPALAGVDAR